MQTTNGAAPVLVLTTDEELTAGIRRACAAAEREVDERIAPVSRREWLAAHRVVLDADAARACADAELPRRAGVHLVCAGRPELAHWQAATSAGAESVVVVPDEESTLMAALARREDTDGSGLVVAVVGGRGGSGASTFAAALAVTGPHLLSAPRSLLVDCDVMGGGLDLLLGTEQRPGLRWPSLVIEGGAVSGDALHAALPGIAGGTSVLSCGREPAVEPGAAALTAVVEAGRSGGGVVVCDVPRQSRDVTDIAIGLADVVVVVVRAQVRAVAAAAVLASALRASHPNIVAVLRGPSPGGLRRGEIADLLELPIVAAMRPEPGLATALERGGLALGRRSPLRRAAATTWQALAGGAA